MAPRSQYDEPFHWRGPRWNASPALSLRDLLVDGTIDAWQAAVIWAALARRRSLAVIGGPSGVGKTTLLTALTCLLPMQTRLLYLRGCFETFTFLHDDRVDPKRTALLVNEISPHLPIYLWGPAVDRSLDLAAQGFALLATAHGRTVPEFVATLTGSPLHIAPAKVAALEFVALLASAESSQSGRRVDSVWRLSPAGEGMTMQLLVGRSDNISQEYTTTTKPHHTSTFPIPELRRRCHTLVALRDGAMDQSSIVDQELGVPSSVARGDTITTSLERSS